MIGLLRQQKQIASYACHTRPRFEPHGYFRADRCLSAGNLTQRFREFERDATTVHFATHTQAGRAVQYTKLAFVVAVLHPAAMIQRDY
ncbi:hypothetical protein [Pantoea dispersa]|uniref:hypothetical protein n=1 Tax=Pantoea dispersa TaxID=59814 RepID=UPI0021F78D1D|nr:hypothetical protein [Pantoea dispersa]UYP74861.1 hypothetical protein OF384_07740 [Pantoea dispersa]